MIILKGSAQNIKRNLPNEFHYGNVYEKIRGLLAEDKELIHFFCSPVDGYDNALNWEVTIPAIKKADLIDYDALSSKDRIIVAEILDKQKSKIAEILSEDRQLSKVIDNLFCTPSTQDIKVVLGENGIKVCLIQWGHNKLNEDIKINPLTRVIEPVKNNKFDVTIQVHYTDGSVASDKNFFLEYNDVKEFITDKNGNKKLGKYLKGSKLKVYDIVDGDKRYIHQFTVDENIEYKVSFPLLTEGIIRVINQKKEALEGVELDVNLEGQIQSYTTDDKGTCQLIGLEVGKELAIELAESNQIYTFPINMDRNVFEILIHIPIYSSSNLKIVDQNGNPLTSQKVKIKYQDQLRTYTSDPSGNISLNKFEINNTITVSELDNEENHQEYVLSEDSEELIFEIKVPEPKFVKIRLLDHKNNPVPNTKMELSLQSKQLEGITDKNGICTYPYEHFTDKEKIKATIFLIKKDKKGNEKTKIVRSTTKFHKDTLEYDLKLWRFNKLWLLLLLLLLFIPYNKKVFVKVVDAQGTPLSVNNIGVKYIYHPQFWYNKDTISKRTDSLGLASIGTLQTSGFSFLYALLTGTKATTMSFGTTCYGTDTAFLMFHDYPFAAADTITLRLTPATTTLDFKVVDKEDKLPIPDAQVIIESVYQDDIFRDTVLADVNGRVLFKGINKCSQVKRVYGSLYGYYPDSIMNTTVDQIAGDIDTKRTLKLTPQKNKIEFFVVDCISKKAIAGALVTITIEGTNKKHKIRTNTYGQGRGFIDNIHILSDLTLEGEYHPFYGKGYLPKYKAETFINLPDSSRTLCLPPKPNLVEFQNIDNYSKTPLAGVTNQVLIKKVGKQETHILKSDINGNFSFHLTLDDTLSIISSYSPDYITNDTTIRYILGEDLIKHNINKRTIPLNPEIFKLMFKTVEADNLSKSIPNADIRTELIVNGKKMILAKPLQTDMNGEAVLELPVTALVSITASKQGYGQNTTKVNNKNTRYLKACDQIERNIPLKDLPPPCNTQIGSGNTSNIQSYNMMDPNMKFEVEYDMNNIPDNMIIYCGHKDDKQQILFESGFVQGGSGSPAIIDLATCSGNTWITIEIIISGGSTSIWDYTIKCP